MNEQHKPIDVEESEYAKDKAALIVQIYMQDKGIRNKREDEQKLEGMIRVALREALERGKRGL